MVLHLHIAFKLGLNADKSKQTPFLACLSLIWWVVAVCLGEHQVILVADMGQEPIWDVQATAL